MPILPRPQRLTLHDAINYVAERCKCETENAGKAVHAALGEGALRLDACLLVRGEGYKRVDTGICPVPSELWARYPWRDFLRHAVRPGGNPMYRARAADGQPVGPTYSQPTIATTDVDIWLDRNGRSYKVPAGTVREGKELNATIIEPREARILTQQEILAEIERYEARISGILSRFRDYRIAEPDADIYSQLIIEIADLLIDACGPNPYSKNIMVHYNWGMQNVTGLPSQKSVTEILSVIRAAHTRLTRRPEILMKKRSEEPARQRDHIFIIHGRNEAKWRELKDMIANTFHLKPIILSEQPDAGQTIIEKFEKYAEACSYAIALFTPDDEVTFENATYLQARPNVIYELGWFLWQTWPIFYNVVT